MRNSRIVTFIDTLNTFISSPDQKSFASLKSDRTLHKMVKIHEMMKYSNLLSRHETLSGEVADGVIKQIFNLYEAVRIDDMPLALLESVKLMAAAEAWKNAVDDKEEST